MKMESKVTTGIVLLVLAACGNFTAAHQNNIMNIDLDFDPPVKAGIIQAAKKHLKTTQEPVLFDLANGLIMVNFKQDRSLYVLVNPETFEVNGFNDNTLRNNGGSVLFTEKQRISKAKKLFEQIPKKYANELEYDGERHIFGNIFRHQWYRKVDRVLVLGEELFVDVDAVSGDIVLWQLSFFEYPSEEIDTTPEIDLETAVELAKINFETSKLSDKMTPKLVVVDDTPMWVLMLYNRYLKDYYVVLDANTGEVKKSGHNIGGTIPKDYDFQGENISNKKDSNALSTQKFFYILVALVIVVIILSTIRAKKNPKNKRK